MELTPRRSFWLMLLLAVLVALAFQGSRGLYESTEGRYALCAWEMVHTGNWLEPTLEGRPHWTKPPLAYWGMAAGIVQLGRNEWGVRFYIALAFVVTVLAVSWLGTTLWDWKTGCLAGLIYATSPFPAGVAFSVNTDTFLCLWKVLAVLAYWRARRSQAPRRAWGWLLLMWALFGFGFLTKGPPALLPLLAIIVFHHLAARPEAWERAWLYDPLGLLAFALVGLTWYLYEVSRQAGLLSYFLGKEVLDRVASPDFGRHPQWYGPFTVYLPVLVLGGGLWVYDQFRVAARLRLWRAQPWRDAWQRRGPALFLTLWFALPLLVFSLSRSRLPNYVVPVFVPIVLVMARWLVREWAGEGRPRRLLWLSVAAAAIMVTGKGVSAYAVETGRDLRTLYRLCADHDRPGQTRFCIFETTRGLGLGFYLQTDLVRAQLTPSARYPGQALADVLDELRRDHRHNDYVFVLKPGCRSDLLDALRQAGLIAATEWGNDTWLLVRVDCPGRGRGKSGGT